MILHSLACIASAQKAATELQRRAWRRGGATVFIFRARILARATLPNTRSPLSERLRKQSNATLVTVIFHSQMTVFYGMRGDEIVCFHINMRSSPSNTLHRLEFIETGGLNLQCPYGACSFATPGVEVSASCYNMVIIIVCSSLHEELELGRQELQLGVCPLVAPCNVTCSTRAGTESVTGDGSR